MPCPPRRAPATSHRRDPIPGACARSVWDRGEGAESTPEPAGVSCFPEVPSEPPALGALIGRPHFTEGKTKGQPRMELRRSRPATRAGALSRVRPAPGGVAFSFWGGAGALYP